MPDNPNPQGKAALPLLSDLQAWRSSPKTLANHPRRTPRAVVVDYLSALLVLSAEFNFRPVLGKQYHLYFRHDQWQLSLVGPSEWRPSRAESYVAACSLKPDASWQISPATGLEQRPDLLSALASFEQHFRERVQSAPTLSDGLPHYEAQLPYYRRVLASGLASSLQGSLVQLGLESASSEQLLLALQHEPSNSDQAVPSQTLITP
ncbi:MAG: DUF2452 domain-containing protein [Halioglobus sp.]